MQEKTSPVSMEPQESVSAEEQADNEIEVNNQVIHEIIDNQSTEETTKQADEKRQQRSKSKWRQSLMEKKYLQK